jgi:hypothetical protein
MRLYSNTKNNAEVRTLKDKSEVSSAAPDELKKSIQVESFFSFIRRGALASIFLLCVWS